MASHLRPSAPTAPDVLLPGDPGRALALAQELLTAPRMSNHARGLWGYGGLTDEGRPLTVQATGIGGPSIAVVLEELAALGAKRCVRIGTCRPLGADPPNGSLAVIAAALSEEGASRALGARGEVRPDARLTAALSEAARAAAAAGPSPHAAPIELMVVSCDLYYDRGVENRRESWLASGAAAVDLGTATLFALGPRLGLEVACLLVVCGGTDGASLDDAGLERRTACLGRIAARALAAGEARIDQAELASGSSARA